MMHAGSPFLFCLGLLVLVLSGGLPLLASDYRARRRDLRRVAR